ELPCRLLGVHDGVVPDTQVSRLLGLAHRWNHERGCFEPVSDTTGRSSDPRVWIAGDAGGVEGEETAAARGALAAVAIAVELGRLAGPNAVMAPKPLALRRRRGQAARRFLDRLYAPTLGAAVPADDTIVCRCEAVTAGAIRAAIRAGAAGPNRVKAFTRCGMGPCQGRLCGLTLTRLVAAETGRAPEAVGALGVRPPLKPVLLGDLVAPEPAE
ncbi:MAG: (2Fe-2S)-binding protein, partial [Alphaproteobacteria bacterium]